MLLGVSLTAGAAPHTNPMYCGKSCAAYIHMNIYYSTASLTALTKNLIERMQINRIHVEVKQETTMVRQVNIAFLLHHIHF